MHRTPLLWFAAAALVAVAAGCDSTATLDDPPDGPSLRLEIAIDDDADRAAVTVRAHALPPLFGFSLHLQAPAVAPVDDAASVAVLGSAQQARTIAAVGAGRDVALGGTRVDPALGTIDIDDDTEVAHATLRLIGDGEGRLAIVDAVAIDLDGTVSALAGQGAELMIVHGGGQ